MSIIETNVRTPFWAQFPAEAVAIDWTNHDEIHRTVMGLFTNRLPGAPDRRRHEAGILYRVDHIGGEMTVLVQSMHEFETLPTFAGTRAMTVPQRAWDLPTGEVVQFRLAINPIKRTTIRSDEAPKTASGKRGRVGEKRVIVPEAETPAWIAAKMAEFTENITVVTHRRDIYSLGKSARRGTIPPHLVIDTVDGFATVTDGDRFEQVRREGLGGRRAYGSGLLTALRIG